MNQELMKVLNNLSLLIAEDYVAFLAENGYHEEDQVLRPESYVKGVLNNMSSRIEGQALDYIEHMGVNV